MKVWISTGASCESKSWKNQEVSWQKLLDKLKTPIRTDETHAEYLKMPKDQQAKIKDVGGFVGGIVTGGRRLKNSVSARYVITLDIDYGTPDFWDDFMLTYTYEACLYSTHKHGKETPRYRLLLPIDRPLFADEYEAVARRVAGNLGIELFDPTTFQPERLMYWPSCSSDGEYVYLQQTGDWLEADKVLAEYADWKDISQWPVSDKVDKKLRSVASKQEDPALKGGLVGVFCRVRGMAETIRLYLNEVYEESAEVENRWTFRQGSTSGGLVVYDDKWAFSHHSTDPVSGRMCNAFDLVRIHLYGDSDDRVEEGTPTVKKPSYDKMVELVTKDEQCRKLMVGERVERKTLQTQVIAKKTEGRGEDGEDEGEWMTMLEVDKKGNILNTIANCVQVLTNDKGLRGTMGYDDLRKIPMVLATLPWRKVDRFSRVLTDVDDAEVRQYLEMLYGLTNRDKIKDAMDIVMRKHTFHPVKEYLKGCKWDGKERVDRVLVEWLGAEDSEYVRQVTRKTLVGAVARVFEPGVKFDTMLVLTGPQGLGKSRLIAKLAGEWYSDTFGNLQNKDAMEQIQGVWIMEIGELAGLKKQEVETIKLFVSKQEDRFRVAYARRVETFARQCIFIGTTNSDEFLQDVTGNRRFWPVRVGENMNASENVGKVLDKETVNQIWAEACVKYVEGEDLYLVGEMVGVATEIQEEHSETHDLTPSLMKYLALEVPGNWYEMDVYDRRAYVLGDVSIGKPEITREYITVPEIWIELVGGTLKDMTKANTKYIRDIMNKMKGWKRLLINRKPFGTQRGWAREGSILDIKLLQNDLS